VNNPVYRGSKPMMRCWWNSLGALSLTLILATAARAAEGDAKTPDAPKGTTIQTASGGKLLINSKSVLYDFSKRVARFETEVTVTDSQIQLNADRMDVSLTPENSVRRVEATGNVVIRELGSAKKATAGNAVYDTIEDNVVLTDKPYLEDRDQGFYTKGAERIIYFRGKQQFKAEGDNLQIEFGIPADRAKSAGDAFNLGGKPKDGTAEKKDGATGEKKETPAP
jgi:lipopolysaccharide transport protein LptA